MCVCKNQTWDYLVTEQFCLVMNLCTYTSKYHFLHLLQCQSFTVETCTNGCTNRWSSLGTCRPLFQPPPEPSRAWEKSIMWFTRHKSCCSPLCLGALKRNRLCTYDRVTRCGCDLMTCVWWRWWWSWGGLNVASKMETKDRWKIQICALLQFKIYKSKKYFSYFYALISARLHICACMCVCALYMW